jgi:hypothetical protein
MIPAETTSGMGRGEIKQSSEEVNSNMIYVIHCKKLCKCHNVHPLITTIKKKVVLLLSNRNYELLVSQD